MAQWFYEEKADTVLGSSVRLRLRNGDAKAWDFLNLTPKVLSSSLPQTSHTLRVSFSNGVHDPTTRAPAHRSCRLSPDWHHLGEPPEHSLWRVEGR